MSDDGLRGRALRGAGWVLAEKWSVRLVSLGVFALLTRTVAPEAFGLLSLTTVFIAFLMVFVDSGFAKSLIQKEELAEDDATTAFWTSLGIAVVLYGALFFAAPLVASLYDEPELAPVLRVMGLGLLANAFASVPAALLERAMEFRALSLRSVVGTILGGLLAVPLALNDAGVWALVAQTLGTNVSAAVLLWFLSRWRPKFRFSVRSFRAMLAFGMSILGLELMNTLQANIDKLLIGSVLGTGPLGVYFIAQRLLNILTELLTTVIGKLALTTFSKLQSDRARLQRAFLQATFASTAVAVPVFGTVAILGDIIVPYIFGAATAESVPIMQILAVSATFAAVVYFDKNTLLAVGQPRRAFLLGLVENVVGIVLLVVALPFGLVAVAFARAARLFLVWPYRIALLRRWTDLAVKRYIANIVIGVFAFALPAVLAVVALSTPWSRVEPGFWLFAAPVGTTMVVSYFGSLWFLCGAENRAVIRRTLRRK